MINLIRCEYYVITFQLQYFDVKNENEVNVITIIKEIQLTMSNLKYYGRQYVNKQRHMSLKERIET